MGNYFSTEMVAIVMLLIGNLVQFLIAVVQLPQAKTTAKADATVDMAQANKMQLELNSQLMTMYNDAMKSIFEKDTQIIDLRSQVNSMKIEHEMIKREIEVMRGQLTQAIELAEAERTLRLQQDKQTREIPKV